MRHAFEIFMHRLLVSLMVCQGSTLSAQPAQTIVISEIMARNDGVLLDEESETSDWIELYNPTPITVDLEGWFLTDKADELTQWIFPPDIKLAPGDYLVVFTSGKDRSSPGTPLHTNFKLSGSGEYLALVEPDGTTVAYSFDPDFGEQLEGISFGTAHHTETLLSSGSHVTFRTPGSGTLNSEWAHIDYNDTTWHQGQFPLSFEIVADTLSQDIGVVQTPGFVTTNDDVYIVTGEGSDIGGQADAFHYVFQPLRGDGELTARVLAMSAADAWAKAGIMIRETLDTRSKYAMSGVTGTHGTLFQGRVETGQTGFQVMSGNTTTAPVWVRLTREGHRFTAYYSEDGEDWVVSDTQTIQMQDNVFMGLCVTSHKLGQLCTALFREVSWDVLSSGDVTDSMLGQSALVLARSTFNLEHGQSDLWDQLTLSLRYQDGFALYLNGHRVTQGNAPDVLSGSSTALTPRASQPAELIDLMPFKDQLVPGKNVLALVGLNDRLDDPDFFMGLTLIGASSKPVPQYFATPTPGQDNVPGSLGQVPPVVFSHTRGFHSVPFTLSLQTDSPGTQIKVTWDGSRPTQTHGTLYTQPIHIDRTTTLRVLAFRPGYFDSEVMTQSYLFPADIVTQSPQGERPGPDWPHGRVNGQIVDYGMDPEVVTDERYKDSLYDALVDIPSLSLVTDLDHLFGIYKGIYSHPGNDGRDWERPVSAELIHPDGTPGFHVNAGLRIRGGYSRSTNNPKHAFRLLFRSEYGPSKLTYPLFGDEGVDEFDKIDLRTSQNYSWSFGNSSQNTMVREVFSRDLQGETGHPYTRSRYYHLYLNGQYWGLYMTQERSEASHAAAYLGGSSEDYDCIKTDSRGHTMYATDGTMDLLYQLYDLAVAGFQDMDRYYKAQGMNPDGSLNPAYKRLLDVDNVIDFMITEYYTGDRDGPGSRFVGHPNNTFGVINRTNPDGFKWFQHDNEHSLGAGSSEVNMVVPFTTAGIQRAFFNQHWLHEQLMLSNAEYRLRFADHVYQQFFNQGILSLDKARTRISNRASQIMSAMIAESARWGDAKKSSGQRPFTVDDDWLPEIQRILHHEGSRYLTNRVQVVMDQLRAVDWVPALDPPVLVPHGGQVVSSPSLFMGSQKSDIYYTTDGSDPRLPIAVSHAGEVTTLVDEQAEKRYLIPASEPAEPPKGTIGVEYWDGINGNDVTALTNHAGFPNEPDWTDELTQFEIPTGRADQYGTRVQGMLHPPSTALYTFWIASDDGGQLWLSTDESPDKKTLIAHVDGWTGNRQWDKYASQKSDPIVLIAGQKYYVEALYKEGGGGDNLAVAWQYDNHSRQIIEGMYLSPATHQWSQWASPKTDDSTWSQATGALGYDTNHGSMEALIQTNIQDHMLGINTSCLVRIPFDLAHTDYRSLMLTLKYDDGFLVYLNGAECLRVNYEENQTPQWDSAASQDRVNPLALTPETYDLTAFTSRLRTGDNLLAIQGLNHSAANEDFLISASLTGSPQGQGDVASTARLYQDPVTLAISTYIKARAFNGAWSALTEATFGVGPVAQSLRLTELMYHPLDNQIPSQADAEYIEFKNTGSDTINLALVQLSGGISFTFPALDLAPGEHILVVKDQRVFESVYGPGLPIAGEFDGTLSNRGEQILCHDASGTVIIDFLYQDQWYAITDGKGFSLVRHPDAASDMRSDSSAWHASHTSGGSPGFTQTP